MSCQLPLHLCVQIHILCLCVCVFRQVLVHTRGLMGDLACNLPAPPVAAVEALPNLYVIADASGGLSVLDASGGQVH